MGPADSGILLQEAPTGHSPEPNEFSPRVMKI
jgi:hypothetical protein